MPPPEPDSGLHFLLVEDDPDLVLLFRRALARTRCPGILHLVKDGQEGLDYLAGNGPYADRAEHPLPCLVVTDLKMPRLTGIELLGWIRSRPVLKEIPVVVLSTSDEPDQMRRSQELGALAYWVKPSDLRQLEKVARRVGVFLKLFCRRVTDTMRRARLKA
jgi:CheY-like chemotaxis protein